MTSTATPHDYDSFTRAQGEALAAWLGERLDGASDVVVPTISRCSGGYSAETFIFTADYHLDGTSRSERFVLRVEVPEPAVYPQQVAGMDTEVEIQFKVMTGLSRAGGVPLAGLVGFEGDTSLLGVEFFVMTFVDGLVPPVNPPYTKSGFFYDATPEQRRILIDDGLRTLTKVHAVDWEAAGLGWLAAKEGPSGTANQVRIWDDYLQRELGEREHPLLAEATAWLHANVPADETPGFSWGDARPGNMIFDDFHCACVTDFENSSIAPPWLDLGWWLMFDRASHERLDAPRLPGEPTREEMLELYAAHSGRAELGDMHYHELFAAFRYAAIYVRTTNRSLLRGQTPPSDMWRENGPVQCIRELLGA